MAIPQVLGGLAAEGTAFDAFEPFHSQEGFCLSLRQGSHGRKQLPRKFVLLQAQTTESGAAGGSHGLRAPGAGTWVLRRQADPGSAGPDTLEQAHGRRKPGHRVNFSVAPSPSPRGQRPAEPQTHIRVTESRTRAYGKDPGRHSFRNTGAELKDEENGATPPPRNRPSASGKRRRFLVKHLTYYTCGYKSTS